MHDMDLPSMQLLQNIWDSCTGILIVATWPQYKSHHSNNAKAMAILNQHETFMKHYIGSNRLFTCELECLTKEATFEVVEDTMAAYDVNKVHPAILDKVYEVSGGNPLYTYEITKALAQSQHLFSNEPSS